VPDVAQKLVLFVSNLDEFLLLGADDLDGEVFFLFIFLFSRLLASVDALQRLVAFLDG
jgi:hypothetical protein